MTHDGTPEPPSPLLRPFADLETLGVDLSAWCRDVMKEACRVAAQMSADALSTEHILIVLASRGTIGELKHAGDWLANYLEQTPASHSKNWRARLSRPPVVESANTMRFITSSLGAMLQSATQLAVESTLETTIKGRHLLAALLACDGSGEPTSSRSALADLGLSAPHVAAHFAEGVLAWGGITDRRDVWARRVLLNGAPGTPEDASVDVGRQRTGDMLRADLAIVAQREPSTPRTGQRLDRFRLIAFLGSGSYSVVWLAAEAGTENKVAVKIFSPAGFPPAERLNAAVRFWEGAAAAAKFPQTAPVARVLWGPEVTGEFLWFAMPHFAEGDLHKWMVRGKKLSSEDRIHVVDDILDALSHTAAKSIVHRDLRPDNVLVQRIGERLTAALCDFDVAHHEDELHMRRATVGPLGLPRYRPPELLSSGNPLDSKTLRDPQIDFYSVAMIVFDLFAGPFVDVPETRTARAFQECFAVGPEIVPTAAFRRRLARFCACGLAFRRDARYRDLEQLRAHWTRVKNDPLWVYALEILGGLAAGAVVFVVTDWLTHRQSTSELSRTVGQAAWYIVTGAASLGAAAWFFTTFRQRWPKWRTVSGQWIQARPSTSVALVALLYIVAASAALVTQLPARIRSLRVLSDQDCIGRDENGHAVARFEAGVSAARVLPNIPIMIECPSDGAKVRTASALTPNVELRVVAPTFESPPLLTADRLIDRMTSGSLRVMDLAIIPDATLLLAAERVGQTPVLRAPDGALAFDYALYLVRFDHHSEPLIRRFATLPMMSHPDDCGALTVVNNEVLAFVAFRLGDANRTMAGTVFHFGVPSLAETREQPVFGSPRPEAWGFFPRFEGQAVVHSSYDGDCTIRDGAIIATFKSSALSAMKQARQTWQRGHSGGLWPTDQPSLAASLAVR